MTTWDEIRDEIAGMLADGKPLEDVIAKLEQRKNEPTTNEKWFEKLSTKEKATWLDGLIAYCFGVGHITESEQKKYQKIVADVELWLREKHDG